MLKWMPVAALISLALSLSANEIRVFGPQTIRLAEKLELPLPANAMCAQDFKNGHVTLYITCHNDHGCAWTLFTEQPPYLADGTNRFIVSALPHGPHYGALDAGKPLAMTFPTPHAPANPLMLVFPAGIISFAAPVGDFRLEIWKGLRFRPAGSVDNMNRMFTIDASDVAGQANKYRYERAGQAPAESENPVWRDRLDTRTPFDVQVTVTLTNGETLCSTARVSPKEKTTPVPLPDGEILVGLCFYSKTDQISYVDAFIREGLGNLAVFWSETQAISPHALEYTRALADNSLYSMTIYQGLDAREVAQRAEAAKNHYFLNNNIGEYASYVYQGISSANACKIPQQGSLKDCRDMFTDHFMADAVTRYHRNYPYVFSTCGASTANYELEGGVDFMSGELYAIGAQNLAWATSEMRGAARKWGPEFWCGWLAHEWQTCQIPYTCEQKFALLRASLYQQYLMGTRIIVLESGSETTQAGKYTAEAGKVDAGYDEETPRRYRCEMKHFYDFVKATPRAKGTPETRIALAMGNNDLYVGIYIDWFVPWAQYKTAETNANWKYGDPERTWVAAQETLTPLPKGALSPYPNLWLAGSPFGQVDVVGVDGHTRLRDLVRYKLLAYAGWNSMTAGIMSLLRDYVRNGGTLFISLPHFSARDDREYRNYTVSDLIRNGDLSELIDVSVCGKTIVCGTPRGTEGFTFEGLTFTNEPVARITASREVKVVAASPEGTPILVSQTLGKGKIYLLLTWEYAGKPSLSSLYKNTLLTLAGRVEQRVKLDQTPDAEAISFSVYDDRVYMLNVDCRTNRVADVTIHGKKERVSFSPGEFKILPVSPN